jgi:hypothetical protein
VSALLTISVVIRISKRLYVVCLLGFGVCKGGTMENAGLINEIGGMIPLIDS